MRLAYLDDPNQLTDENILFAAGERDAVDPHAVAHVLETGFLALAAVAADDPEEGATTVDPFTDDAKLVDADLAAAERHLAMIPDALQYGPNKAMLVSIRSTNAADDALSAAQRTFLDHELLEAALVRGGLSQEEAHQAVVTVFPHGSNYSPDVIRQFSTYFSDTYFKYWGMTR